MSELSSLLGVVVPLSWAAAVSPVAFSIFLVIMSMTEKPRLAGISFYAGAIMVLLVTLVIGVFLGQKLAASGQTNPATMASIDLFLGAVLVLLGIRNFAAKNENKGSNILDRLQIDQNASIPHQVYKYFTIGIFAFIMNFSTAIFVLAAGRAIGVAHASLGNDAISIVILIAITLLIIEVPLIFFVSFPKKAQKLLVPVDEWIHNHGNLVTGIFCIVIGIFVVYSGLQKLGM